MTPWKGKDEKKTAPTHKQKRKWGTGARLDFIVWPFCSFFCFAELRFIKHKFISTVQIRSFELQTHNFFSSLVTQLNILLKMNRLCPPFLNCKMVIKWLSDSSYLLNCDWLIWNVRKMARKKFCSTKCKCDLWINSLRLTHCVQNG